MEVCGIAGLDHRFKVAVPVYGCGFIQDNRVEDWMTLFAEMTPERRKWWHDNCDPSVYLKDAEMPILFVTGTALGIGSRRVPLSDFAFRD